MTETMIGLLYSLIGFTLGFVAGRVTAELRSPEMPRRTWDELHGGPGSISGRTLGVVVVALSVLTVASAAVNGYAVTAQQNCIRDYNREFAVAFQARANAADNDREALNTMLIAIGDTRLSQAMRREKFEEYLSQIKDSDEQRRSHPLPAPPDPNQMCS